MDRSQIATTFDQQAAGYDQQWAKLAPLRDALHLLMPAAFAGLAADARLLCVGAGTGAEILFLAERFPAWRFVAVEPSAGMVAVARQRAEAARIARRVRFHTGYLDTLQADAPFDAATSLLVSQFLLDPAERTGFFRGIADRLAPGGALLSSDLALDPDTPQHAGLLELWMRTMAGADLPPERMQQIREAYRRDVAILPPRGVEAIIAGGGFEPPMRVYQAGMIHAWLSRRATPGIP